MSEHIALALVARLALDVRVLRRYLNFEGADEPSEGPYATSIPLMHAMNPANDVVLVFGQNGRVLHPDHGYVRILNPDMRMMLIALSSHCD